MKLLTKTQKLFFGVLILIVVDVIKVSSNELSKFLYHDEQFNKPFFSTYFKTSMFTIYLVIIGIIIPWKESFDKPNGEYSIMESAADDDNYSTHATLSDPTFIPIRAGDVISGTESDDSSLRSVRFSKVAEVREMSPHEATEALMARLSYSASLRIKRQKTHHKTAKTALLFNLLWFFTNYLFQISMELSETSIVTLLSSTSSFFVLSLAAFFPSSNGDKFTITKFIAVAMNLGGVILVTMTDVQDAKMSRGAFLAFASAFFYAAYLVFIKRKNDFENKIDIPLFFGFVGLWNLLLMWPILLILNFLKIEQFELPNQNQFAMLFSNALIGTVISEALWLWGCFLTSSLIGTLGMSLCIPLSILFDVLLKKKLYISSFSTGAIFMVIGFMLAVLLKRNDDSDPLMHLFKLVYRKLCSCQNPNVVRINDDEQQESLIGDSAD